MKKLLLLSVLLSSSFSFAQILQSDNFDNLTIGNVGTDYTGATMGQGGWFTLSTNGAATSTTTNSGNANFQIVANGFNGTKGVMMQTPNGTGGGKYMWKDGLTESWDARTVGNNIIEIEVDFFTGSTTTSRATTGVFLYDEEYNILGGFYYVNNTRKLSGVARLYDSEEGEDTAFLINLASGGMTLTANTWYRLAFGYDSTTGQPIWNMSSLSGGSLTVDESAWGAPLVPYEINLVAEGAASNTASANAYFDRFQVQATATDSLLGTDSAVVIVDVISASPNPTSDIVNISSSLNTNLTQVNVIDLNGRTVKAFNLGGVANAQINIGDLSSGVYMLNITSEEGTTTKKVVKN